LISYTVNAARCINHLLATHGVTIQILQEQLSPLLHFKLKLVPVNILFLLLPCSGWYSYY